MTQFEVAAIFTEAYAIAATHSNAANGFSASGIWPVDRLVFAEQEFVASDNISVNIVSEPLSAKSDLTEKCNHLTRISSVSS